jgi:hypothetical protein
MICKAYQLQAYSGGGSWTALNCLGESVGGLIVISGDTISTGCIDSVTLNIINGYIKFETDC